MRCRYIEFYDVMSVPMAIALSGQLLLGQPVMVKPSEAEKNLVQSTASSGSSVTGPHGPSDRKLYVGNLHFNMTEQQLRQVGHLYFSCSLFPDATQLYGGNPSWKYCYVLFRHELYLTMMMNELL